MSLVDEVVLSHSSTSGIITSMYDVSFLLVTTFVSYYGGQQSKARWLGAGLILLILGNFIFIMPHFIIGSYEPGLYQSYYYSYFINIISIRGF